MEPDWTCPFCSLLCDGFALERGPQALVLHGTDCPRARAGLAAHAQREAPAAWIDGSVATFEEALAEAARRLAQWRQPLLAGLGTDMAGARALYRLAARTGALYDHADGEALMHGLRALQDRGQWYTTLAEIRARADLMVCVGTQAVAHYPEFFRRCGLDRADTPCRRLVFFGGEAPARVPEGVPVQCIAGTGELLADLQQLAACLGKAPGGRRDPELAALATALREARYAVLVWEAATLPAHGALAVELLNLIVATLNASTRAGSFALGGSDGAYAVQQVFTWLSGLPLRTRATGAGAEHDPLRFAGPRLLDDHAVDGLLWVWSFAPDRLPPPTKLPRIVLGPPAMGPRLRQAEAAEHCVFLPVATPGLNAAGHLFRTDGVVVPLVAARDDGLPGVDRIAARLLEKLEVSA
ncbi:MAG TPA: formylmethanofuran dehydrogenase [Ramlibacter sp.]|uniref:formylmethanofuran dehydrogenase n=1 Tax=Ramlibacter sp. TaxID=1917967 RepID=UPI002D80F3EF|nr:formylmethanofuran dehydrogenase [Ramlibacter sp.]HET8747319.1 formylmethanofuran dehydrogenase [Ramlibacter sp.]